MKFIDRAKSHFESLGVQHIEVPEWKDEAGNPSIIYWNPINLSEKNKLFINYFNNFSFLWQCRRSGKSLEK